MGQASPVTTMSGDNFMYFQKIGFGFDGTGCGQYAYVPASGDFSYTFCCRPDDPEYSAGSVYYRKIDLLDGA